MTFLELLVVYVLCLRRSAVCCLSRSSTWDFFLFVYSTRDTSGLKLGPLRNLGPFLTLWVTLVSLQRINPSVSNLKLLSLYKP